MKKVLVVLAAVFLVASCASNTSYQSFYKKNKEFSQFAIGTPAFIANIFIPKEEFDEYGELFKKIRHYKVMLFEENNAELNRSFNNFVKDMNYTSLVRINDAGNEVHFFYLKNDDLIKEMVLKVQDNEEFVLIGIKTKLYEQELFDILDNAEPSLTSLE
jgi:hypothetical protein